MSLFLNLHFSQSGISIIPHNAQRTFLPPLLIDVDPFPEDFDETGIDGITGLCSGLFSVLATSHLSTTGTEAGFLTIIFASVVTATVFSAVCFTSFEADVFDAVAFFASETVFIQFERSGLL